MACGLLLAGCVLMAQDVAELKKSGGGNDVQEQLKASGVAIKLLPNGGFQIFARGNGTYDFDDVDDVEDARKEGELKAKAALAKFMKEKLSTEEGFSEQVKKVKSLNSNGDTQTANVSKETIKMTSTVIRNSADALLKGVVTIDEKKVPRKGSSGIFQVTVGISSKTLKAVGKLVNALDATPEQGQGRGAGSGSAGLERNLVIFSFQNEKQRLFRRGSVVFAE